MNFQYPFLLTALLPLVFFLWWNQKSRVSSGEKRRFLFLGLSIAALIFSLANPYWSEVPGKVAVKGVDVIILMDVSQSMFCTAEGKGRRIDQARNFLRNLLPQFSGGSVAVVYFAARSVVRSPRTWKPFIFSSIPSLLR
jgi:hypothetical protein